MCVTLVRVTRDGAVRMPSIAINVDLAHVEDQAAGSCIAINGRTLATSTAARHVDDDDEPDQNNTASYVTASFL
jgi:hypothetical protein